MYIYIKRAELVGDPDTKEKYIRYKGAKYKLQSKDWEEAEKEAKELLKRLYPNESIVIG